MPTLQNHLMPLRDYSEHEVCPFFALDGTGLAGMFVTMVVNDPSNAHGWSPLSVGASYDGAISLQYETKAKVTAAASGATKHAVLGATLFDTRYADNNGLLLKYEPQRKAELQSVVSGEAVPVLKRGLITLRSTNYIGTPTVGAVGIIADGGKINAIPASSVTISGNIRQEHVVGRFISETGDKLGGYALFEIKL